MFNKIPNIPALSSKVDSEVKRAIDSLKSWFKALETAGGISTTSDLTSLILPPIDPSTLAPLAPFFDGTIPQLLSGLKATGGFGRILIEWTRPVLTNFAYVEVFRSTLDNIGALDVGNAGVGIPPIGSSTSEMYADTSIPNASMSVEYYYWARIVTEAGVYGPMQTAGVHAHTANDPTYVMEVLDHAITATQLSHDLDARIDGPSVADGILEQKWGETILMTNANVAIVHDLLRATLEGSSAALEITKQVAATLPPNWIPNGGYINNATVLYGDPPKMYRNKTGVTNNDVTWIPGNWTEQGTGLVDLYSEYTVKLDNEGNVAGYGLSGDNVTSQFIANVDTFAVKTPVQFIGLTANPVTPGHTPVSGDLWAYTPTTGRQFIKRYDGTQWVDTDESPVPLSVVSTAQTLADGRKIPAGVYIDAASIRELTVNGAVVQGLSADRLVVPGTASIWDSIITEGRINNAYIGDTIQSELYESTGGVQGWKVDKKGNCVFNDGVFRGDITGSRGSFGGTLKAGVLDLTELQGETTQIYGAGTHVITVPEGITAARISLCGAGGGGGGGINISEMYWASGGGGGGYYDRHKITGLAPGSTVTIVVGIGGAGAAGGGTATSGADGQATTISIGGTTYTGTGGGGGHLSEFSAGPAGAGGTPNGNPGLLGSAFYTDATELAEGYWTHVFPDGGATPWAAGGLGMNSSDVRYGGHLAYAGSLGSGGGGGQCSNQYAQFWPGAKGGDGLAFIEFFNPNSVVIRDEWDILITKLKAMGLVWP